MRSPNWDGARGALTKLDLSAPLAGTVTSANCLVGANASDNFGAGEIRSMGSGKFMTRRQPFCVNGQLAQPAPALAANQPAASP